MSETKRMALAILANAERAGTRTGLVDLHGRLTAQGFGFQLPTRGGRPPVGGRSKAFFVLARARRIRFTDLGGGFEVLAAKKGA